MARTYRYSMEPQGEWGQSEKRIGKKKKREANLRGERTLRRSLEYYARREEKR